MRKIKFKHRKYEFTYDVSELPEYIAAPDTLPDILDVLQKDSIFGRISILDGVKYKSAMPDADTNAPLQEITGCVLTPSGVTKFSDKELEVVPVGTSEEYCNEDLVGTWLQEYLRHGLNGQNEVPEPHELLRAIHFRNFNRKAQRLWWLGDKTSTDPQLNMMDGLFTQLWADNDVQTIDYTAITPTNAWDVFTELSGKIPAEALANGAKYEIRTSRANASALLQAIWNDKDYNALVQGVNMMDATLDFVMPVTGIRIVSDYNLSNEHLVAIPLQVTYLGTDAESDFDFVNSKYNEYDDIAKIEVKARVGAGYVRSEWFVVMEKASGGGD